MHASIQRDIRQQLHHGTFLRRSKKPIGAVAEPQSGVEFAYVFKEPATGGRSPLKNRNNAADRERVH
jgi:hypothetical protein